MAAKCFHGAYIVKAIEAPLAGLPFHSQRVGLVRSLLLSEELLPGAPLHIAVHAISSHIEGQDANVWGYTTPHAHRFPEVNIIWGVGEKLVFRYEIGHEEIVVESPASVVIPAGVSHRAEVLQGKGVYLCILLNPCFDGVAS